MTLRNKRSDDGDDLKNFNHAIRNVWRVLSTFVAVVD